MAVSSPLVRSVSVSQKSERPSFDPSLDTDGHCYGEFCVLSLGKPFKYVIPSFDVLCVDYFESRVSVMESTMSMIYSSEMIPILIVCIHVG